MAAQISPEYVSQMQHLDDDTLIQCHAQVDDCLRFIRSESSVYLEALDASREVEREMLRRSLTRAFPTNLVKKK